MSEPALAKPTVAVIGGGYGGIQVAKSLDDDVRVVLVEPKDAFLHNVAALRALVDPSWLPRIYYPYDGLLAHGRVIRDRAAKVDAGRVVLASGEEIRRRLHRAGHRVRLPVPGQERRGQRPPRPRIRSARPTRRSASAPRVLLLGAGPVGIELAGEIKAVWPGQARDPPRRGR